MRREWFTAAETVDWKGYELLMEVCQEARLTKRQGEVVLLYVRGFSIDEIRRLLGLDWKRVWQHRYQANARLEKAFPRLRELICCLELHDRREREDAKTILSAVKGVRRSSGKTVEVGHKDLYGRQLPLGLRPELVAVEDLLELHLSPMDLLPVLLEELLEEKQRAEKAPAKKPS